LLFGFSPNLGPCAQNNSHRIPCGVEGRADGRRQNPAGGKSSSTASPGFRKGARSAGYAFISTAKKDPLAAPIVRTPLAPEKSKPILASAVARPSASGTRVRLCMLIPGKRHQCPESKIRRRIQGEEGGENYGPNLSLRTLEPIVKKSRFIVNLSGSEAFK
jgi:hypothetical protein